MSPSDEVAVAYLLEELEGVDRAAFEARLEADPGLRAEVDALRPVIGRLERLEPDAWEGAGTPVPPVPPIPSVPGAPEPTPSAPRRVGRRLALPAWGLAATACLLIAIGVGAGLLLGSEGRVEGQAIALQPVGAESGATGQVRIDGDEAVVRVAGLAPVAPGDYYELWLLTSPDDLVSLGSFRVSGDGEADVRVPVPVDPAAFRYVDVSLEPGDGDPAHSQRSVLRAPTQRG